jgi:mono/diheme cytochrome c family protein
VGALAALRRLARAIALVAFVATVEAAQSDSPDRSILERYCSECHNATDWAGGVAFDTMNPDEVGGDAEVWEHAVRKLRGNLMPPPGKPQPSPEESRQFVGWMEGKLDEAAAARPNPGHRVLHRLNRTEYSRSVSALLAIDVDAKKLLPPDTQSGGFDNVAEALSVSPSFLEQYIAAARRLSMQAVGEAEARPLRSVYRASTHTNRSGHVAGLPLGTRGGMLANHYFPADGEYQLNLYLDSVDSNLLRSYWLEYRNTLIVTVDGKKVFEASLGGEEDQRAVDKNLMPAARKIQDRFRNIRITVPAGTHAVGVAFLARSLAQSDSSLKPLVAGEGVDRLPVLADLELIGPLNVTGVGRTASREKIFICRPADASDEKPCARRILGDLAREAFRRPITEADLEAPMRFFEEGRAPPSRPAIEGFDSASFDRGIQKGLMAILASPKFLYRAEAVSEGAQPGAPYRVTDIDLASRLSFFIWSQGPDEPLLALAEQGRLSDPAVLEGEARRMLADPRAKSLVTNWAFQWLRVGALEAVEPDPRIFPEFDADLRAAFLQEMELYVESVMREDRSVLQLLSADYTFVNERLARHYGIGSVRGDRFRRVQLADSRRWGLLGKGAILTGTSYPDRTSPVLRGAWLLENIVGTPPASPPPGVETALAQSKPGMPSLTVRARLQAHRQVPSCNQCHGVIDPLGLALENFDATGAWVAKDRLAGVPIDAAGELAAGAAVNGPDDLRRVLLASPDQFVQTLTERLMTFALGRELEAFDMPVVRSIVRETAAQDHRFSSIVLAIVKSLPFQMSQIPSPDRGGSGSPQSPGG